MKILEEGKVTFLVKNFVFSKLEKLDEPMLPGGNAYRGVGSGGLYWGCYSGRLIYGGCMNGIFWY